MFSSARKTESGLVCLPQELLANIVSFFETTRTLLYLGLTCKRLHEYCDKDGFRVFVQNRFPSMPVHSHWKDASHAMTTLSRNWDRRAFIARVLVPSFNPGRSENLSMGGNYPHTTGVQTMGYQPVIDSYEEWTGDDWSSRKQVLAWGAGPSLFFRSKRIRNKTNQASRRAKFNAQNQALLDQHHQESTWREYKENRFAPGKDDITSVNLLRNMQNLNDEKEYVMIGRASGVLNLVSISAVDSRSVILADFETKERSIKSATVNESSHPLLAVCLSHSCLALYHIQADTDYVKPCGEIATIASGRPGKTWSTRFLRHDCLAVGLGPSQEPIHVYDVRPDGICKDSVRKIGISKANGNASGLEHGNSISTSVYPIEPIAPSSVAGGFEGDVFLSGGYDGTVRLHDLRSPEQCTAVFIDPVDTFSAIYSLASFGRERFIAGGARHSLLKIFDLRMPGGKLYYATDLDPCSSHSKGRQMECFANVKQYPICCQYHYDARYNRPNTNVFLSEFKGSNYHRRQQDSPVYSLSSPSPCSPTFFAGVEGKILQIDVVSIMDRHPDPIFGYGLRHVSNRDSDLRMKWNPDSDVLCLPSYNQGHGNIDLMVQQQIGEIAPSRTELDERWKSSMAQ